MTSTVRPATARSPAYRYHLLRAATERHGRDPAHLEPDELARAARQADQSLRLETMVLASAEAGGVVISEGELDASVAAITTRYADPAEMAEDLARNGLDEPALRAALRRELVFDAVMRRVGARHALVTDDEIRQFHARAPERFARPERRTVSQILITINAAFAENQRAVALARSEALAAALELDPESFADLARRHSECPSALSGGQLGTVARGQLYPELDRVLFRLVEGEIAGPIESEIGLHLLRCDRVLPAASPSLAEIREQIRAFLVQRRRRAAQQAWITALKQECGAADFATTEG
ncbi:nitrogen fixation protein NifM [Thioalkalicoccus limnaeus]|uniref:peptidylprolyl isomerase n=1 Tax=Thioalkalicoccus limnaeus TaxID=120681 RepID=A0ABV4BKX8_9GAMM